MRIKDGRSIMFSDTPVPDLFIHDPMPKLSGNAIKCYLFLNSVFYNGTRDATRADLADRLGISEEAVDEALPELQGQRLITVGHDDIAISDLKMLELQTLPAHQFLAPQRDCETGEPEPGPGEDGQPD